MVLVLLAGVAVIELAGAMYLSKIKQNAKLAKIKRYNAMRALYYGY